MGRDRWEAVDMGWPAHLTKGMTKPRGELGYMEPRVTKPGAPWWVEQRARRAKARRRLLASVSRIENANR